MAWNKFITGGDRHLEHYFVVPDHVSELVVDLTNVQSIQFENRNELLLPDKCPDELVRLFEMASDMGLPYSIEKGAIRLFRSLKDYSVLRMILKDDGYLSIFTKSDHLNIESTKTNEIRLATCLSKMLIPHLKGKL